MVDRLIRNYCILSALLELLRFFSRFDLRTQALAARIGHFDINQLHTNASEKYPSQQKDE